MLWYLVNIDGIECGGAGVVSCVEIGEGHDHR